MYLVGMLVILFLANICMLLGMTNWPQRTRERFTERFLNEEEKLKEGFFNEEEEKLKEGFFNEEEEKKADPFEGEMPESFINYLVQGSGSNFGTASIGMYDGVNVGTGAYQGWRGTSPNEPLAGPNVDAVGPDNLFIFKNNQCKPSCCGATLSCDGGCVCTTPAQRNLINSRGGNRTLKDEF